MRAAGRVAIWAWLVAVVASGCTTIPLEPALPFPLAPDVKFTCVPLGCWLSEADANLLSQWFGKLDAFRRERDQILTGQEKEK